MLPSRTTFWKLNRTFFSVKVLECFTSFLRVSIDCFLPLLAIETLRRVSGETGCPCFALDIFLMDSELCFLNPLFPLEVWLQGGLSFLINRLQVESASVLSNVEASNRISRFSCPLISKCFLTPEQWLYGLKWLYNRFSSVLIVQPTYSKVLFWYKP